MLLLLTKSCVSPSAFTLLVCLCLLPQVADKTQKRALQSSYRLLRVWMQEIGLDVPYSSRSSNSIEPAPAAEQ